MESNAAISPEQRFVGESFRYKRAQCVEKHYREFVHKEYRHRVGANIRYNFKLRDEETQQGKSEYGHKSG